MQQKLSFTYRILKKLGVYLSPEKYGSFSVWMFLSKGIRLWKNEILHKLARNAVIIVPAPLSSRLLRPLIHKWRGVKIGKNIFIGIEVMFDSVYPEKIFIGDGCIITNRVQILAHNRDLNNYKKGDKIRNKGYIVKEVVIENDVVLGIESIILPGVTIGTGAVVAAGSVVSKDVEPYTMVAGIPAKKIREFK